MKTRLRSVSERKGYNVKLFHVFLNKSLVSKEPVVLRRWESEKGKFGFIKRVDEGRITTVKIWKADVSSVSPSSERIEEL